MFKIYIYEFRRYSKLLKFITWYLYIYLTKLFISVLSHRNDWFIGLSKSITRNTNKIIIVLQHDIQTNPARNVVTDLIGKEEKRFLSKRDLTIKGGRILPRVQTGLKEIIFAWIKYRRNLISRVKKIFLVKILIKVLNSQNIFTFISYLYWQSPFNPLVINTI